MSALAEIVDLAVAFRRPDGSWRRLVDGITVRVDAGSTSALVGESGSGKSLTALALVRLLPDGTRVEAGTIRVAEVDVRLASEAQLDAMRGGLVGLLLPDAGQALDPVARVASQVTEALRLRGRLGRGQQLTRATAALAEVGLEEPGKLARSYPHQLSGGQRQRALLAGALVASPRLLIADEPTSALDPASAGEVLALLQRLQAARGLAILLISHDLPLVARAAATVTVVYAGESVESGPAADVIERPTHPYTEALTRASRVERTADGRFATIPGAPPRAGEWGPGCRFAPRCPAVMPRCTTARPALATVAPAHQARCFLAHDREEPGG